MIGYASTPAFNSGGGAFSSVADFVSSADPVVLGTGAGALLFVLWLLTK